MNTRELKGLEIAARSKLACVDGAWMVPSQSGNGSYTVKLDPDSCTCEDFQLRGWKDSCKHVIACRLVRERDGIAKGPTLDTNVIPKNPTCERDWSTYNLAASTEKYRLQVLLHDLCQGIEEVDRRPGLRGRKPHLMRDMVFAAAFKVYVTFSSRRYACDLQDAFERGYLTRLPHHNKVNHFLEDEALTPVLKSLIIRSSLPLKAVESQWAPDSSGFSTSRFERWYDIKYQGYRSGRAWIKAHVMAGVKTHIIAAVEILDKDAADCPQFKPLTETTAENFKIDTVSADKAYLSNENLELIEKLGGTAFIPFKVNSTSGAAGSVWEKMYHFYQYKREEFLATYHKRSNIESCFSMLKAKFRDSVRSKTEVAGVNEVLCKILCHNICCVIMSQCELGIEPVFWPLGEQQEQHPDILPLARGS